MSFYDQVLREILTALGAALFLGNVVALSRRRSDRARASARTVAASRPGSPVKGNRLRTSGVPADLPQAPVARSVLYAIVGFVIMVWGIASLIS